MLSGSDTDGDTIDNAIDNCPSVANANQANEDGDATGDVCDKCPPYPDTGADQDNDGVGDACDPNPNIGGDTFVFHGFTVMPPGWAAQGSGTTTIAGGDATLSGGAGYAILATAAPASANHQVSAAVTVTAFGSGFVGALVQHVNGTDEGIACQFATADVRIYDSSAGGAGVVDPTAFTVALNTRYELRMRKQGTGYTCRAAEPPTVATGTLAFSPASPEVGLRVRSGASARYHWVMIVTSP
jgi:hypothetical protein